ncbi:ribose-phosphate pyrophosphokinase [Altererythrobacter lutimaris]|uniref:Ribose-phosphate pyrophosphokinase n=1 Tax=Altererythrobacter lutimaris TaxID=2743979 RepID=A0A850HB51_9SPHN|nr:ribose-phosphate pyrophosphokinase [Altererythrobacter lutimaris]NVE94475.1 ribose-phosphate pyrophosphokinase [Altererythrobacter lutimaris]
MPTSSKFDRTISEWLEAEGIVEPSSPGDIADTTCVRELLIAAAREARALSYSEILGMLGHRFTRPKMRALCKTLDAIDESGRANGEPGLAVLVVRESDRLPGQGWWVGNAERLKHNGDWTGAEAAKLIRKEQRRAFAHWRDKPDQA